MIEMASTDPFELCKDKDTAKKNEARNITKGYEFAICLRAGKEYLAISPVKILHQSDFEEQV